MISEKVPGWSSLDVWSFYEELKVRFAEAYTSLHKHEGVDPEEPCGSGSGVRGFKVGNLGGFNLMGNLRPSISSLTQECLLGSILSLEEECHLVIEGLYIQSVPTEESETLEFKIRIDYSIYRN